MEIPSLSPRHGKNTLRVGNSDKLVIMEHAGILPKKPVSLRDHGVVFFCTEGRGQFDYDGRRIELQKGDMFLYYARSVVENMMASSDFDGHEIWFGREALWDINKMGKKSLFDLVTIKQFPKVTLFEDEATLMKEYYHLLSRRMRDDSSLLQDDIVHTIFSAMLLDILCIMRRGYESVISHETADNNSVSINTLHGKMLVDRFIKTVEDSDGRIRRVDEFSRMLNVTPKYLMRQLKDAMGHSPSEIIQLFTVKSIEYRLRYSDMTMQQIADDLHFASASFFGRYVKEHLGMTPLEYRSKYQKEAESTSSSDIF